jgi:hypothetical protein
VYNWSTEQISASINMNDNPRFFFVYLFNNIPVISSYFYYKFCFVYTGKIIKIDIILSKQILKKNNERLLNIKQTNKQKKRSKTKTVCVRERENYNIKDRLYIFK